LCGVGALLCLPVTAAVAQDDGPATGAVIWTRIGAGNSLANLFSSSTAGLGVPQIVVGYQGSGFSLGLAVGLNKFSSTNTDPGGEFKSDLTVWQIGPSALINFFTTPDGMTRANAVLEATYGKVSDTDKFTPAPPVTGGFEDKFSGTVYGFRLGAGGDHFFGQHFALGAEVGFEGNFLKDLKEDGATDPPTQDGSSIGVYGALRTTFAF
jgi:hypothetical protein